MNGAWSSPIYRETVLIVLSILFLSGLVVFFVRKKNFYFVVSWASIKSWLFVAPPLFVALGLPEPYPLLVLTFLAILGAKVFFQLMGMYNRSYFVWICYLGIMLLAYAIYKDLVTLYNIAPMIVLGVSCFVPLARNSYKRMIQYISLTNLAFVFLGWSFMHLGLILKFDSGLYQLMYLVILTEFADNTTLAISRYVGKTSLFDGIDTRRTFKAICISSIVTIAFAGGMRHLLPDRSEIYWLTSGVIASLGGLWGDLVMAAIRKDAGVRVLGAFVLGRGDYLQRMDRLIFVAPIYYYVMIFLGGHIGV